MTLKRNWFTIDFFYSKSCLLYIGYSLTIPAAGPAGTTIIAMQAPPCVGCGGEINAMSSFVMLTAQHSESS